jgi:hypothetical protein
MTPDLDFRAIVLCLLVGKYGEENLEQACETSRRIKVALGIAREPNGLTRRRRIGQRYKVTINRGWTDFAYDAARLMISRNQTLDPLTEKILLEPAVPIEQLLTQLKRITLDYVRKGAWYSSTVDLHEERRPYSTTFLLPGKLYELICYFMVAHELGHILAGHLDGRCPKTSDEQWAAELEADRIGINILLACLGTPWGPKGTGLSYASADQYVSGRDVILKLALTAVAVVFGLMDLWSVASHAVGALEPDSHPSARRRYLALRKYCIEKNLVGEQVYPGYGYETEPFFERPVFRMSPTDHSHFLWGYLAFDINWTSDLASFPAFAPNAGTVEAVELIREKLKNTPDASEGNAKDIWMELNPVRVRLDQLKRDSGSHDAEVQRYLGQVMIRLTAAALFLKLFNEALTLSARSRSHCENVHFLGYDTSAAYQLLQGVWQRIIAVELGDEMDTNDVAAALAQADLLLRDAPVREVSTHPTKAEERDGLSSYLQSLYNQMRELDYNSRFLDDVGMHDREEE